MYERPQTIDFFIGLKKLINTGNETLILQNVSIDEFLRIALKNTNLSYEIENEVIIIRPSKEDKKKETTPRKITGTVMDMQGNTLPGATILIKETSLGVVTDVNGKFSLEIPQQDSIILVVSFVGYETKYITLDKDQKELSIKLKEDVTEMEEVVVTDTGKYVKKASLEVVLVSPKNN